MREIQSFVRRSGRLTLGQKLGLGELWPSYGVTITEKMLDLTTLFFRNQPVVLEVGFGNGDSLLEMAIRSPEQNFLGIEVYESGIGRLINQAHKQKVTNLKVINADAVEVLKNNIENNSIHTFQLFFPDPWHKKKHHKRRLVQTDFLNLIASKIQPYGNCHMATDWQEYAEQMLIALEAHPHFKNTQPAHTYTPKPERRPNTKFEKRGERLGHGVWDLIFTRED
jgi:tRNA (guanine-N7-)-methyltransferase